jgi:hypothetical protein
MLRGGGNHNGVASLGLIESKMSTKQKSGFLSSEGKTDQEVYLKARMLSGSINLEQLKADLPAMGIASIARKIREDWKKVDFGAAPYLDAMIFESVSDNYGCDSGSSIVAYFLSNASTWRGPVARMIKAELNKRIKP